MRPDETARPSDAFVLPDDEHNRNLVQGGHPPDWRNPDPLPLYNLVVIGAGTAGLVSAAGAAGLGARVALVERHLMGGDCLNVGCVPSKALIRSARAAHDVRTAPDLGIAAPARTADFATAMERMRRLRARIGPNDSAQRFAGLGVDVFLGQGELSGPDSATVGGRTLRFKRAILATGARATMPSIPGLADVGALTNETVFWLTELPERLVVLGAGPIGCELAQCFARFGSTVTLATDGPRILPREDADAARLLDARLRAEGIRIVTGFRAERAERQRAVRVLHGTASGGAVRLEAEALLVGVGRSPNVEGIGLDRAGVKADARHGIVVDDRLRTTNPRIFAAGDCCSAFKFTHAADAMARIAIQNALFFGRKAASSLVIPWVTYTDPEVAHVGLYEDEARRRGHDVRTLTVELRDVDRAILDGEEEGFARALYDGRKGKVLGITIVARHAGEMIGEASLLLTHGLTLQALASTIHPYPTQAESLKRLGDAYMRTRLTPRVKGMMARYFSLLRRS